MKKIRLISFGITSLVVAVAIMRFLDRNHNQEENAIWRIQGVCIDERRKAPIKNLKLNALFREAWTFHQEFNSLPSKIRYTTTITDKDGKFEFSGVGGYVRIWDENDELFWSYEAKDGVENVSAKLIFKWEPVTP
jgi:hypothetical protein